MINPQWFVDLNLLSLGKELDYSQTCVVTVIDSVTAINRSTLQKI